MTVLTVPSTCVKPDKEPLVDARDRFLTGRMPPSDYAKVLEAGGDAEHVRFRLFACRAAVVVLVLLFLVVTALFVSGALCYGRELRAAASKDRLAAAAATVVAADAEDDNDNDNDASDADALSALMPADADALSALMPSGGVADERMRTFKNLARLLGPPPGSPAVARSARFIHDFSVNVTGVVDVEGRRCFVMPLVRDSVSPPKSLYDLLIKMSSGYYFMDVHKAMAGMRVVKPAVRDLSPYGLYISKDCANYATYKLESADVSSTTVSVATANT